MTKKTYQVLVQLMLNNGKVGTIIFSILEMRKMKHRRSDLSWNPVLRLEPQRFAKPEPLTITLYSLPRLSGTTSAE